MSFYYPQAAVILRVTWEDFGTGDATLKQVQDLPISCTNLVVERNDYSEADTVSLSIDYNSFPFDPRCIRACGISVFMEDMKSVYRENGLQNIIEPSQDNKIFIGFADEGSIEFDDTTRTVKLTGRDYTALLIDTKRVNTDPIPLGKPVDQIIQDLIQEQEATKEILVVNRTGEEIPNLSKLAPDFNPVTSVKNQSRKETYWDIIQGIISRIGLVGFIEIDKFILTKPQNIYEKKQIKQFIYGGNIKSLSFERKLGRSKNFNVKILCFNPITKTVEEALIPKDATNEQFIANFGNKEITLPQLDKDGKKIEPEKPADYLTFPVKDIGNKEQLIKIGESIYEELSRQQIEGKFSTFEMEIPEELENSTKVIKFSEIRNGTAIRIYLSQEEINAISSSSSDTEKLAFLMKRGYPKDIALAFAKSLDRINTAFYTKSVKFTMDKDDGFSMDIEFINFIDLDSTLGNKR